MRSKKALKNIISNLMFQISVIVCNFIIPILTIKNFGSNVNGLVLSITQFLTYITLLDSGVGVVIRSYLYKPIADKNKEEIENILYASNKFFKILASIFIIYIIVLCIIYPSIVSKDFDRWFTISLILILSLSTFFEYFFGMSYRLFLQADQKNYVISNIQTVVTILNAIIVVILINLNFPIQIVKLGAAMIFIARPIVQNIYVKRKYHITFDKVDKNYKIEKKWDGFAQHVAAMIHNNTDTIILSFFSLTYVSIYAVYSLVVKAIKNITSSFATGLEASFGDMYVRGENEHLNKSFKTYEIFYLTIITIAFICTYVLITPFVSVYTRNVVDADYFQPLFGYLIVLSEYIYMIRIPYNGLVLAAGHFKETRKGAWGEALINIVLSIILINIYGLVGVVIATLIAMTIRSFEFIYHTSKYILKRSLMVSFKMILVFLLEFTVSVLACKFLPKMASVTYLSWIIYAIEVLGVSLIIVFVMNSLFYNNERKNIIQMVKRIIWKNRV